MNSSKSSKFGVVLLLIGIMLGIGLLGPRVSSAATSQTYDNVQIFITPQNSSLNVFSMSVYNSTGGLIVSSDSPYPAFSFELPSGSYLFTATAGSSYNYAIPAPLANGASNGATASGSAIILPRGYYGYEQEYGFVQSEVNSSESLSISTSNLNSVQTSDLTIVAKYANGTAAANSSVYASVVGDDGYYFPGVAISMSNETGNDGTATLTVPDVPLEVTVWNWLPVNLPQTQVTTEVTVAGQPVNVTAYWQPSYIGVAGSAFLIPPFQNTSVTLEAQQQNFWAYPQGVASTSSNVAVPGVEAAGSSGTVANSPEAVPANVLAQQEGEQSQSQIVTQPPSVVTLTTTQSVASAPVSSNLLIESGILVAVAISIIAAVLALRKK